VNDLSTLFIPILLCKSAGSKELTDTNRDDLFDYKERSMTV
jgi:hypothetical protein